MINNFRLLLVLLAIVATSVAAAEDDGEWYGEEGTDRTPEGWAKLYLGGGALKLDVGGRMGIERNGNLVTVVDWDRFGLDHSETSYWFQVNWRPGEKWGLWGATYKYDETGYRLFDQQLDLGDGNVIPVGALVQTDFETTWYILEATRTFIRSSSVEAGIGFGIHAVDLDTELFARIRVDDREEEVIRTGYETLAPLPNVMGFVYWKPTSRWLFASRLGWFGLSYDKYDGRMINANANLTYRFTERFAMGLGYMFVKLDVDIEEDRFTEVYDLDFEGPLAYIRVNF